MITTFEDLLNYKNCYSFKYFSEKYKKELEYDIPTFNVTKLESLSFEEYADLIEDMYETIFDDYWRNKDVRVAFILNDVLKVYTLAQALIQLIYFCGFIKYKFSIPKESILDIHGLEKSKVEKHCVLIGMLLEENVKDAEKRLEILQFTYKFIIEKLFIIGKNACYPHAFSISLRDIENLARRNSKFRDLINSSLPENISIKDSEIEIQRIQNELSEVIEKDKHNEIYIHLKSKKLDKTQFSQMFGNIGYRSDVDKNILPFPTNTNFLRGLRNITDYINECIVGRDAELNKKLLVGKAGYISKKIDLLCNNLHIDYDMEDCGTTHFVEINVKSEYHLKALEGKYMIKDDGKLEPIISWKHKNLIGENIKIRSHICCKNDKVKTTGKNYVCKTCFGAKADMLRGTSIGGLPSTEAFNPLLNKCMSTKHKTSSKVIDILYSTLNKFFKIDGDEVFLKYDLNYSDYYIRINKSQISEDTLSQLDLQEVFLVKKNSNEQWQIDEDGISILLSEEILDNKSLFKTTAESEYVWIDLSKIDKSQILFNVKLMNEDASFYLQKLNKIFEGKSIRNFATYDDCLSEIVDIMYKAQINTNIFNLESVVYKLIRDKNNKLERPDFNQEFPEFIFCTVSEAIMDSESFWVSISFEDLFSVFSNGLTYEKHGSSQYDSLFKVNKGRVKFENMEK